MICPRCLTDDAIAFSAISNGLVCLVPECGFEQELDSSELRELLVSAEETALCA